jgi:hypothetical protein
MTIFFFDVCEEAEPDVGWRRRLRRCCLDLGGSLVEEVEGEWGR